MKITKYTLAGLAFGVFALAANAQDKASAEPEAKPEPKLEAKPEPKPEAKPEAKPEEKPEEKPAAEPETAAEEGVQIDGAQVGKWTMDFDAAVKLATEKSLPMMLNFTGSDWCGWCKLMDKGVFAKEEWKKFAAENVVLVTLDFPRDKSIVPEKYVERNQKLKAKFGVRGYPTYVVIDSDGETKIGQLGAGKGKTPASFIEEFKGVTKMSKASVEAYLKANPDKAEAYKAAIAEQAAAKKEFSEWAATRPQKNEENDKKFAGFQARMKAADEKLATFK